MKKVAIISIISISIVLFVAMMFYFIVGIEEKPPKIETGEFPFVVEYELNGERFVVEDTVVCEFDGYDLSVPSLNKPRKWNEYLKSGDEDKCVIISEENRPSAIKNGRHNEWAKLRVYYGCAEYYMGDPSVKSLVTKYPQFIYYETYKNHYNWGTKLSEEDLEKYFGIKVIRFEFSEPIKNEFK